MERPTAMIPTTKLTATIGLELTDYLERFKGIDEVGVYDQSPVFKLGGYDWEIRFYPAGQKVSCAGHASVELSLVSPGKAVLNPDNAIFRKLRSMLDGEAKVAFNKHLTALKNMSQEQRIADEVEEKAVLAEFKFSMIESKSRDQIATSEKVTQFFSRSKKQDWCCPNFIEISKLDSLARQGGGSFSVLCHLTVSKYSPPMELLGDLERLLKNGLGANITFLVGGHEFPAHKSVLAARSPIFEEQLFGTTAEQGPSRMELKGVEPRVFEMLLQFIYTGFPLSCADARGCTVKETKQLLVLAERYGLNSLKAICEEELEKKSTGASQEFADLRWTKKPKGV